MNTIKSRDERALSIPASISLQQLIDMPVCSLFVGLLLAVGSNAVKPPSSQCAYLYNYFQTLTFLPSLLQSVNNKCIAGLHFANLSSLCIPECQSLYSTYSQCTSAWHANGFNLQTIVDRRILRNRDAKGQYVGRPCLYVTRKAWICAIPGLSCANPGSMVCGTNHAWIGHAILGLLERKAWIRTIQGLPCAKHR